MNRMPQIKEFPTNSQVSNKSQELEFLEKEIQFLAKREQTLQVLEATADLYATKAAILEEAGFNLKSKAARMCCDITSSLAIHKQVILSKEEQERKKIIPRMRRMYPNEKRAYEMLNSKKN